MRTIAASKLNNLNIKDYFPARKQAEKVFEMYDEEGEVATRIHQKVSRVEEGQTGGYVCVIKETLIFSPNDDPISLHKESCYEVCENRVIQVYQLSSLFGESNQVTVELKRSPSWKTEERSVSWITGINQTVCVAAGEFKNCLEVTEQAGETVTKKYYAPNQIGLALTLIKTSKGPFIVFSELVHYVDHQYH